MNTGRPTTVSGVHLPSLRQPWSWRVLLVGLGSQVVVLLAGAVTAVRSAFTWNDNYRPTTGTSPDIGAILGFEIYLIAALVIGCASMLPMSALVVGLNPRTRVAALIVAGTIQPPILFCVWWGLDGTIGAVPLMTVISAALVLFAVVNPSTRRWANQPEPVGRSLGL